MGRWQAVEGGAAHARAISAAVASLVALTCEFRYEAYIARRGNEDYIGNPSLGFEKTLNGSKNSREDEEVVGALKENFHFIPTS